MYKSFFKRLLDLFLSGISIIILSPVLLFCVLIIPLESKGPILFKQTRLGKNGMNFMLFKFRTMYDTERKSKGEVFLNNDEVTRIGYFLRRFKIDELPQLINIFIGDMSIVGPRPALPSQRSSLNEDGEFRLLVKPGPDGFGAGKWQYLSFMGKSLEIRSVLCAEFRLFLRCKDYCQDLVYCYYWRKQVY